VVKNKKDNTLKEDLIMETKTAKIELLFPNAHIPTRGSSNAAGYDLYAYLNPSYTEEDQEPIYPGQTVKVGTGVAITPPEGYFGAIFARSGLATKKGLRPANAVGVADYDYTGEYIVALHNDSQDTQYIKHGERIAQLIFLPYINAEFDVVEKLSATQRGDGGFGSSDVK
jgi:dUTP pyrophosphatase